MLCIYSSTTNPFFNIASEEHLLKNFTEDIFMLYRNTPSVIIGKHQNTMAEIDYWFAKENGIDVVRRLSGGGAVYHDLGNLNFTFIKNGEEGSLVDFKGFTLPIIKLLAELGVEAAFEGHNSLTIKGQKFSGNAEHVFKRRVMHHGTMLFSTNLDALGNVLYVNTDRYSDKAVKSVRANTTNICEHVDSRLSIDEFGLFVFNFIIKYFETSSKYVFSDGDKIAIEELVSSKYTNWDWNFGYSPPYSLSRELLIDDLEVIANISVEKGSISKIEFEGGLIEFHKERKIVNALTGCRHKPDEVEARLVEVGFKKEEIDSLLLSLI